MSERSERKGPRASEAKLGCDYIATPRKSSISCDPEAELGCYIHS
ncbi:MAG: hypothetical protein ACPK85_09980 [Methanosarcina sp.]